MSPTRQVRSPALRSLPRTRGDEPGLLIRGFQVQKVCPALAGMSPVWSAVRLLVSSLPRTRGDEPLTQGTYAYEGQSAPHSRG